MRLRRYKTDMKTGYASIMTHPTPSADFLSSPFAAPVTLPGFDPTGPDRFFNRELSWLAFNWRVLEEAMNPRVPLLERVRFLSISATNLDEFYTVRVAGLRELARAGHVAPSDDGKTPAEQLVLIDTDARRLMEYQQEVWANLRPLLAEEGITILSRHDLTEADRAWLQDWYLDNVFPVLSPLAIDPAHPFPFIPNAGFSLALELEDPTGRQLDALVPVPGQIDRFVRVGTNPIRLLPLEELILAELDSLFPGYQLRGSCTFSVLRDSDLEVEEEAEDLVREFEVALKRRRRGEVVRLKLSQGALADFARSGYGQAARRCAKWVELCRHGLFPR